MSEPTWNPHDKFCPCVDGPCCPWMGPCECQCNCDFIGQIREDERTSLVDLMERKAFTPRVVVPPQCRDGHDIEEWRGRRVCVNCGTEPEK